MRNPDSKVGRLRQAAFELLKEHERDGALPTSNRFLYYELIQRRVISKERQLDADGKPRGRRPDQDLADALFDLREDGRIPWGWIVDETRAIESYIGSATIRDGVIDALSTFDLDPWNGDIPLILTESRSLAGVLRALCSEYCVRIAATNGQCGGFLRTDIAPILSPGDRVLYLGDYDLAGNQIEENTRRVLERECGGTLRWERLALTEEQVREHDLPKIIKHDKRYNDERPHEAVETEALSQVLIVQIVRDRLDELLPEPLERVQERAEQERATLLRTLRRARGR